MPLTSKGSKILSAMQSQYGDKKGTSVFYASINKGKLKGVEGKYADGGAIERLPDRYAEIGAASIEDRRDNDPTLRAMGISKLKKRFGMKHSDAMMDSQRTEAEVVDRLVPRKYAKGGRAMALAKRIMRRKYADGGDVDYMRPDVFFPQAAKSVGQLMAPELTRYLTEPEPSYESRLRAAGADIGPDAQLIPNRAGKVPETGDPRAVGAMGDVINLATSAVPVGGPAKVAMAAAPLAAARFARGLETVVPKLEAIAPKGIRAYHGSPHDFDRFDLSRIGTGEGAQSYGHGLYFAENPETARYYRDMLADVKGNPVEQLMAQGMKGRSREEAIAHLRDTVKSLEGAPPLRYKPTYSVDDYREALKRLEAGEQYGRMYEVNINARPEQFLDWDKPLTADQSKATSPIIQDISSRVHPSGAYDWLYRGEKFSGGNQRPFSPEGITGQNLYQTLNMEARHPAQVSERLREAGVPGIKYLDQGSRFDPAALQSRVDELRNVVREHEKGIARGHEVEARQAQLPQWQDDLARAEAELRQGQTHNYVVFDDKLIDILRKYGLAGMLGGGAGAATLTNQNQGMQDGGSIMNSPYPQMWQPMAAGGTPWEVRAESRGMIPHSGFIPGTGGGRSDTVPMSVKKGAYVIPADIVSALGDGNSQAGASKLASKFGAPYGAPMPKIGRAPKPHFMGIQKTAKPIRQRFANGGIDGDQSSVADIIASHGEFVLSPEQLEARFGSLDLAHEAMDKFVENVRKKNAKISRKLPGPKKK
jgi:hypothetical protein